MTDNSDLLARAKERHETDEINIDEGAAVSEADGGVWVAAWVWVPYEASDNLTDDCATCAASTETRVLPCDECGYVDRA